MENEIPPNTQTFGKNKWSDVSLMVSIVRMQNNGRAFNGLSVSLGVCVCDTVKTAPNFLDPCQESFVIDIKKSSFVADNSLHRKLPNQNGITPINETKWNHC